MAHAGPQTHTARRALDIAFAALDQPDAVRHAWARAECGDDAALAAEVEALLAADLADEPRLDSSALNEDLADARIGSRVGRYRISARIGTGGMGVVYRAEPEEGVARQPVALKLIKRGMDSEEILRRFMREREILGRLEHPHIARLLDGGMTDDGSPWFALELVQGQPLTRYCDQHQLSLAQRIRLFLQVCEAVEYAHRNLVIHRDLKPGNVLVTTEAEVKLLDFGIARLVDPNLTQATRTRAVVLTPEYSAPEQFERGHITTQTDVYQLGVLLGELLSGQRPARAGNNAATHSSERLSSSLSARSAEHDPEMALRAQARAISVRGLARALRGDLDRIVRRATHPEPERRYASAIALAEDLRRYLDGRPVLAMGDSFGYWLGKFVQRNRWGVAGLLTILVSVGVGWVSTVREAERLRVALHQSSTMQALLEDVFLGADPWEAKGVDTLASDLLKATEQRLQDRILPPALSADLWFKIGSVHVSLQQNDAAVAALQQGMQAAERAMQCRGIDCVGVDENTLRIQIAAAQARLAHFRLRDDASDPDATKMLDDAIRELRRYGVAADEPLAGALRMWIHVRVSQGQMQGVKQASEEVVEIVERSKGAQSTEALYESAYHAANLRQLGLKEEALHFARKAYEGMQANPDSIVLLRWAYVAQQYGAALVLNGRFADAEQVLEEALLKTAGEQEALVLMRHPLYWELAELKSRLGKYPEAVNAMRQFLRGTTLDRYERAAGEYKLGMALLASDDDQAAIEALSAARQVYCDDNADSPPCVVVSLSVVDALLAQQDWQTAAQRLLEIQSSAMAQGGRLAARWHLLRASQLLATGQLDAAESALNAAEKATEGSSDPADGIARRLVLAQLAEARHQTEDALRLYREVVAWHQQQGSAATRSAQLAAQAIGRLEEKS